jgi:hypothetical protein
MPASVANTADLIRFTPGGSGKGLLYIDTPKSRVRTDTACYLVDEFPCDWRGRSFHLKAAGGQSDKTADGYDVFLCASGLEDRCDCKGFTYSRGKPCKHLNALRTLVRDGQL